MNVCWERGRKEQFCNAHEQYRPQAPMGLRGVQRQKKGVSLAIKVITPQRSRVILTQPWKGEKVSGWEVAADASRCFVTHPMGR